MTACTESGCGGAILADGYCNTCGVKGGAPAARPSGAGAEASNGAAAATAPGAGPPPALRTPTPQAPGPPAAAAGGGSLGGSGASGSSSAGSAERVPVRPVGSACGRDGCAGHIASDGYCDTCGLAADSAGGPVRSAPVLAELDVDSGSIPSIAVPLAPDVSTRLPGAGTATARSRTTTASSRRTGSARTGIGVGLVTVPPTTVGDPAAAVMSDEKVQGELGIVPEEDRHCAACGRPVGQGTADKPGRVKGFCGNCRTAFDFVTNEPSLVRGEIVAGQYEILGPLAHGGMGWIYLGRDRAVSNRWVVLKGLLNEDDPDAVAAAVAERQFLAQIEHANIVNIYNFVTHRGAGYIVMEMVGGESLNAKLKARREANGGIHNPLPVADAIAYMLGILPALGYLHELGLVYNDLKPANVMAVADGVKLIDVGAVMRIDDRQAAIFGTQGFQAPEVATTGPSVASDLYTVGRTLAVLIIRFVFHQGTYLYSLPSPAEAPLFARWESLYRFLLRATAFHPDDRFQTAAEMAEQLTGVLREIVALTESRPRPTTSTLFDGDQLAEMLVASSESYDVTAADWRVLPAARVNEDDPAAPFLIGLPEGNPVRTAQAIKNALDSGQVPQSDEVYLRYTWELIQLRHRRAPGQAGPAPAGSGGPDISAEHPENVLRQVEASNPWEWRVAWYRSIHNLQIGRAAVAAEGFSRVWTELPGETAPKLAVALAAELAGEFERALELYDLVISTDSSFVSAAFGMARCNWQLSNPDGVVASFNRVPTSSAAHYDAQVAAARALVAGGPAGEPSLDDLAAASATIQRLQLDAAERAALSADIFERALAGVRAGRIPPDAGAMLGRDLTERSLREGLEHTYRIQARLAPTAEERVRLVDKANLVRPRSLF
ncbi:MAG: tetratricopeptide repeat protein [Actinomycetota bacterium]